MHTHINKDKIYLPIYLSRDFYFLIVCEIISDDNLCKG